MLEYDKTLPEVLVVGAGPVGLSAALFLAKNGIRVQIVDNERQHSPHSYALALHSHSLKLFDELGLLNKILEQSYRVRTIGLYDGEERRFEMGLAKLEEDFSFLAVIPQHTFEDILKNALNDLGVKVLWNHRIVQCRSGSDCVSVEIDKMATGTTAFADARNKEAVVKSAMLDVP